MNRFPNTLIYTAVGATLGVALLRHHLLGLVIGTLCGLLIGLQKDFPKDRLL